MSEACYACGQDLQYGPEPADTSVVLDKHGDAWQRREGSWDCVEDSSDYHDRSWQALNKLYGPLEVVYLQ